MTDDDRELAFIGDHAENLESGALVGPGDRVKASDLGKGDKWLLDEGRFIEVQEPTDEERRQAEHDSLVAQASALKIRGRTNMSTDELRAAIADREKENADAS